MVKVVEIQKDAILVEAMNDAVVSSRRHINLPGISLRLPAMTEKDKQDIARGLEQGMNIVAASFVRTAKHIQEIRDYLDSHGGIHVPIIAKIENQE